VCQVTVDQAQTDLADGQRLCAIPEHVHDGTLKFAQPVHGVTLSAARKLEKTGPVRANEQGDAETGAGPLRPVG
jgi:hypothetical protein